MIIPVRCFTCGHILADKYRPFKQEVIQMKIQSNQSPDHIIYFSKSISDKTPEAIILDKFKLFKPCCRRHMLTHIDIE